MIVAALRHRAVIPDPNQAELDNFVADLRYAVTMALISEAPHLEMGKLAAKLDSELDSATMQRVFGKPSAVALLLEVVEGIPQAELEAAKAQLVADALPTFARIISALRHRALTAPGWTDVTTRH